MTLLPDPNQPQWNHAAFHKLKCLFTVLYCLPVNHLPHWDSPSPQYRVIWRKCIETQEDLSALECGPKSARDSRAEPHPFLTLARVFPPLHSYNCALQLSVAYTHSASHPWLCHEIIPSTNALRSLPRTRSLFFLLNMNLEDMVGETLQGDDHEYHIQSLQIRDDYLDVYLVTRADNQDEHYEAQAFARDVPRENEGLCQARRRRMKRIFRSKNFESEIEHGGRRFLISRVQRNDREWRDLRDQVGGGGGSVRDEEGSSWTQWEGSMSGSMSSSEDGRERRKGSEFRTLTKKSSRRGFSV